MQYLRLKKQSDFKKLFDKGKRAFAPSLTLVYKPAEKTTMGISVGKRHGKSVVRNRIKRLLREAFRENIQEMKGTYSFVLIPKVSEKYAYQTFCEQIRWIIRKENL